MPACIRDWDELDILHPWRNLKNEPIRLDGDGWYPLRFCVLLFLGMGYVARLLSLFCDLFLRPFALGLCLGNFCHAKQALWVSFRRLFAVALE